MSVINTVLPVRTFQLIRDRIGAILFTELDNQAVLRYNVNLDAGVWVERWLPFDNDELPAVNVSLQKGMFKNKNQRQTEGEYFFVIDCYASAPSTEDSDGDSESVFRLHDLAGMCQSIIEDSRFKTLGFIPGVISNHHFDEFIIEDPNSKTKIDLYSVTRGRLILVVNAAESNTPIEVTLLKEHITQAKLYNTSRGYQYAYEV